MKSAAKRILLLHEQERCGRKVLDLLDGGVGRSKVQSRRLDDWRQVDAGDYGIVLIVMRRWDDVLLDVIASLWAAGLPSLLLLGHEIDLALATAAMRAGARDLLIAPISRRRLREAVESAGSAELWPRAFVRQDAERAPVDVFAVSDSYEDLQALLATPTDNGAPLLVYGESGVGKRWAALALHAAGPRREEPFVAVRCCLLRSSLVGRPAAATAGGRDHTGEGLLAAAGNGTVYFDDIRDLRPGVQQRLRYVIEELQDQQARAPESPNGPRFISGTGTYPPEDLLDGRLQRDLFFRLAATTVRIPPLRETPEDVPLIARFLLGRHGGGEKRLSASVEKWLGEYSWPGNLRELDHVVEQVTQGSQGTTISSRHLPFHLRDPRQPHLDRGGSGTPLPLFEVQRRHILDAVRYVRGNHKQAAQMLGIDIKTLRRRLELYDARRSPTPDVGNCRGSGARKVSLREPASGARRD